MEKTISEILEPKITSTMEGKWFNKFEKQARNLGNEVYNIPGTNLFSSDIRELFLMFVAVHEGIFIPKF